MTSTSVHLLILLFCFALVCCDCWPSYHHRRIKTLSLGARIRIKQVVDKHVICIYLSNTVALSSRWWRRAGRSCSTPPRTCLTQDLKTVGNVSANNHDNRKVPCNASKRACLDLTLNVLQAGLTSPKELKPVRKESLMLSRP